MRLSPLDQGLRHMLVGSLVAHAVGLLLLLGWAQLTARPMPLPQNVLVTKLVRLGTPRPKEMLPRLQPAQEAPRAAAVPAPKAATPPPVPTPPAPTSAPAIAPIAPAPTAKERAAALSRVNSALAKLKQSVDGQTDGSRDGETDVRQDGEQWGSEVVACLRRNYIIQGTNPERAQGRSATVVLRLQGNGKIIDHWIKQGSGLAAFDQAVSRAVVKCGQVPPPPDAKRREYQREGVIIKFNL